MQISVAKDDARARLTLVSDQWFSARVLDQGSDKARVALVGLQAMLLGGDHVVIDIHVGAGVTLEIVEVAGTVALDAAFQASSWTVNAVVENDGLLLWNGAPLVVSDGANVRRHLNISLQGTGRALVGEELVLGRVGQHGGMLRSVNTFDVSGLPALREDLALRGDDPQLAAIGTATVMSNVVALGWVPPQAQHPGTLFEFDVPGAMVRVLGRELHRAALSSVFEAWQASALTPAVSAA